MKRTITRVISIGLVAVVMTTQVATATNIERWTSGEYEIYKSQIIEGHKDNANHYRVVKLTKSIMSGYGTEHTNKHIDGVDEYQFLYPLYVGLPQLVKNDYTFSGTGSKVDITKENTAKVEGSRGGEGLYNIKKGKTITSIGEEALKQAIEREYPREERYIDTTYLPYASAIAITEIQEGMAKEQYKKSINKQRTFMDDVGIGESRIQLERHLKAVLTVTERYGILSEEEAADILRYYIILWRESSKVDTKRSLLNYTYGKGQNYTDEYKNKCIYGYSTVTAYVAGGERESTGNIYLGGKRLGQPLFTYILGQPELKEVKKRVEINKEYKFVDAVEMYNTGMIALLAGQQTMTEIGGGVEEAKKAEQQKIQAAKDKVEAEQKAQVEREVAEQAERERVEYEAEIKRQVQHQQVTRGATNNTRALKGEATQKLITTGGVYKPMQLIEKGLEKRVDLTYYVQTHGEWAQERIREDGNYASTYSQGACGYTSMAMIIASINEDKGFTPLTLKPTLQYNVSGGSIVVPHVGYSHGGMEWYINNIGLKKEVETSKNGVSYTSGTIITQENVKNLIDNGGVGILSTSKGSPYTGAGHMVLLVGYTVDKEGNFENMIIQDSNLISNLVGRFTTYGERIRVDTKTGLVYDNFMKNYKSVPRIQMRYASAVFLK